MKAELIVKYSQAPYKNVFFGNVRRGTELHETIEIERDDREDAIAPCGVVANFLINNDSKDESNNDHVEVYASQHYLEFEYEDGLVTHYVAFFSLGEKTYAFQPIFNDGKLVNVFLMEWARSGSYEDGMDYDNLYKATSFEEKH